MQILLVCQFYFVYSKKKYIKEHKKKQKLSWNTDAPNRTWAVCVRVRYRSRYTIAEILIKSLINSFKLHCIILNYFVHMFFLILFKFPKAILNFSQTLLLYS